MVLVAINILVFFVLSISGSTTDTTFMATHGAMFVPFIWQGAWYQLFTAMFLHFGFMHLFNNMLVLFFLGDNLERAVGSIRFLIIYLGGGLIGNAVTFLEESKTGDFSVSAGASGAIFSVIGALLYVVIRNHGRLEDLSTGRLMLMIGMTLYMGYTSVGVNNLAHLGGLAGGFLLAVLLYHKSKKAKQAGRRDEYEG